MRVVQAMRLLPEFPRTTPRVGPEVPAGSMLGPGAALSIGYDDESPFVSLDTAMMHMQLSARHVVLVYQLTPDIVPVCVHSEERLRSLVANVPGLQLRLGWGAMFALTNTHVVLWKNKLSSAELRRYYFGM